MPKKRKRGRPPKSDTLARRQAEKEEAEERKTSKAKAAEPQQAEEEEDCVLDAGAIDDPEGQYGQFLRNSRAVSSRIFMLFYGSESADIQNKKHIHLSVALLFRYPEDSDYNPADEDCKGRPPAILKKPTPPISSSSQARPRRKVGRPRKYSLLEEGYRNKGVITKKISLALGKAQTTSLTM